MSSEPLPSYVLNMSTTEYLCRGNGMDTEDFIDMMIHHQASANTELQTTNSKHEYIHFLQYYFSRMF